MDWWHFLDSSLEAAILAILVLEYIYDRSIIEKQLNKRITNKKKTVIIDVQNKTAVVKHKPKNINVIINTKSE